MLPTYTVTDVISGNVVLSHVTRPVVLKHLNIKDNTMYNCITDNRLCRKKFKIEKDYQEIKAKDIPCDFESRWRMACEAVGKKFGWKVNWIETDVKG